MTARIRTGNCTRVVIPINRLITTRIREIATPKTNEPIMSPRIIAENVTGQDMSLSSVLA